MSINDDTGESIVTLIGWALSRVYEDHAKQTTAFIDDLNTAMTTLGGGYQLTEVDLSGFANL